MTRLALPILTSILATIFSLLQVSATEAPVDPGIERQLRVLTYNIQIGIGMDRKVDLERVVQVIRDTHPDLVALQEVDRFTDRSQGVDQARALADRLQMHFAFGFASSRPGGEYGVAILSRWPILETSNHPLPRVGNNETRTILSAIIETPDLGKVRFLSAHLQNALNRQAERLMQVDRINELFRAGGPPIILGADLNAYPDTPEMERMSRHWINATAPGNTYPADNPTIRLDYIFIRDSDPWQIVEAKIIEAPLASDHLPVLAIIAPEVKK